MSETPRLTPQEVLADPENLRCTCPYVDCERHGNCKNCTAWHRYNKGVTLCMKAFAEEKK